MNSLFYQWKAVPCHSIPLLQASFDIEKLWPAEDHKIYGPSIYYWQNQP
jgi:hypothetical protein